MTPQDGIKRLKKLFGKAARWRVYDRALVGEERQAVLDALPAKRAEKRAIDEAMARRRAEILKADAEYQALLARYVELKRECEYGTGVALTARVQVGQMEGIGFHVMGAGDNWAEAMRKLDAKPAEAERQKGGR